MRNHLVALGLGSNLKIPIQNLRSALDEIKKISDLVVLKVSSIYESDAQLPDQANADWNRNYLNAVVLCEAKSTLYPNILLEGLKEIEKKLGRVATEKWAPRPIDIDILLWDKTVFADQDLKIPHPRIKDRPFVLLPLLEVWPESLPMEKPIWAQNWVSLKPFNTVKSKKHTWPWMVGILNITEDSFSDGGEFSHPEQMREQAIQLLKTGAEMIDIGAESTRPGARAVNPSDEENLLKQSLETLLPLKKDYDFKVSLDCRNPMTVANVLNRFEIDYLNDVSGFKDSKMQSILRETKLKAFVMHSLSVPPEKDLVLNLEMNPFELLNSWWQKKLEELDVDSARLIFDPGIGFGKTKWQSLYILSQLEQFHPVKNPIMIGHSRKSCLTHFTDRPPAARDLETALVTKDLNLAYTQYLRVHDIESQKLALRSKF